MQGIIKLCLTQDFRYQSSHFITSIYHPLYMQEIGRKSHNIVPNSMIKSNQTNKRQSGKAFILVNQHIVLFLQPLELKNLLTLARN